MKTCSEGDVRCPFLLGTSDLNGTAVYEQLDTSHIAAFVRSQTKQQLWQSLPKYANRPSGIVLNAPGN